MEQNGLWLTWMVKPLQSLIAVLNEGLYIYWEKRIEMLKQEIQKFGEYVYQVLLLFAFAGMCNDGLATTV